MNTVVSRRWFLPVATRPATVRASAKGEPYSNRSMATELGKKLLFWHTAAGSQALSTASPTVA